MADSDSLLNRVTSVKRGWSSAFRAWSCPTQLSALSCLLRMVFVAVFGAGEMQREGRKVFFGIRPEHLEPCAAADAKLVAEVDLVEPLGADTLVYGHLDSNGGARIAARMPSSYLPGMGKLGLRYDPANVHYFDAETGVRL